MPSGDVTSLFLAARQGDAAAADQFYQLLYDDLQRLARARLRQHQPFTVLDTCSLVHESYLRMLGTDQLVVQNRNHFLAYSAKVMRSVIVDFARARLAERRGGGAERVLLDTNALQNISGTDRDVIRVSDALESLAKLDERLAQVVEMRFFGGMNDHEIGDVMGVSERTVRRDWDKARLLMYTLLET